MEEKICPFCGEKYSSKLKECPKCAYREPMSYKTGLCITLLLFLPFVLLYLFSLGENCFLFTKVNEVLNLNSEQTLNVRQISSLSSKTIDEIISLRKEYIKSSPVFSDVENYSINFDVYKIDDKASWQNALKSDKSYLSMSVNNPELLINFITPDKSLINPQKIVWDSKNKTIKAYFSIDDNNLNKIIYLDETNARDLGYEWVFCDESDNIEFKDLDDNISIMPYKMLGYYSTKNNKTDYANYQDLMALSIQDKNSFIKFKLWKQSPKDFYNKADITYIIYFQ